MSNMRSGTVTLRGTRIRSPNKVVWSRAAALAGSSERKRLRQLAGLGARQFAHGKPGLIVGITLVRIAPRAMDMDNVISGMKPVRDGVADAFGLRDDASCFTWNYKQEKGEYAVRIEVQQFG